MALGFRGLPGHSRGPSLQTNLHEDFLLLKLSEPYNIEFNTYACQSLKKIVRLTEICDSMI